MSLLVFFCFITFFLFIEPHPAHSPSPDPHSFTNSAHKTNKCIQSERERESIILEYKLQSLWTWIWVTPNSSADSHTHTTKGLTVRITLWIAEATWETIFPPRSLQMTIFLFYFIYNELQWYKAATRTAVPTHHLVDDCWYGKGFQQKTLWTCTYPL